MQTKKVPMRTCVACRQEKSKKELMRVVRNKDGEFLLDRTGKVSGRGAYVCDNKDCMEKLIKKKLLKNAFNVEVPLEVYDKLQGEFFGNK